MKSPVIEIASFEINPAMTTADFAHAAALASAFLQRQPGFIARRLSKGEDGRYMDHVEWASQADANAAAEAFMLDPGLAPFMHAMVPTSVMMHHNTLIESVG